MTGCFPPLVHCGAKWGYCFQAGDLLRRGGSRGAVQVDINIKFRSDLTTTDDNGVFLVSQLLSLCISYSGQYGRGNCLEAIFR